MGIKDEIAAYEGALKVCLKDSIDNGLSFAARQQARGRAEATVEFLKTLYALDWSYPEEEEPLYHDDML